jgi:hypothetical protein
MRYWRSSDGRRIRRLKLTCVEPNRQTETSSQLIKPLSISGLPLAGMAELADAADSKSADPCDRGGSTPPPGTIESSPPSAS